MMQLPPKNADISWDDVLALCEELGMLEERDIIRRDRSLLTPFFHWDGASIPKLLQKAFPMKALDPAAFPHDVRHAIGIPGDERARARANYLFGVDCLKDPSVSVAEVRVMVQSVEVFSGVPGHTYSWGYCRLK